MYTATYFMDLFLSSVAADPEGDSRPGTGRNPDWGPCDPSGEQINAERPIILQNWGIDGEEKELFPIRKPPTL